MTILPYVGLAGLHPAENERATLVSRILEWPMLAAGFWMLGLWFYNTGGNIPEKAGHLDVALWLMFVMETSLLLLLVDDKRRYLRRNWMNLVIIITGLPLLVGIDTYTGALRLLRLLILVSLSIHMGSLLMNLLSRNELGPTVIGSLVVVVMAGFMIAGLDPGIETPADGIWWAWVTVTTVGYGDLVPSSNLGRFFAGILMLVGVALISLLTASIAAFAIEQSEASERRQERLKTRELERQLHKIERKLDLLLQHGVENSSRKQDSQED